MDMQTPNMADGKLKKLIEIFPNIVTETIDEDGNVVRAIDKDILEQEISTKVVEGREERYQFTWPDKKQSILAANAPISKTLRPCRAESKNFDTTENLYIEGDNLEVLKLLQETYLGKIKMIYIDPPYNTGNDFVYNDDFKQTTDEYLEDSGQFDEEGNRLDKNLESNGRFHTDWLNMIYPRLKLARNLLSDDGVIFISIDDNEQENLKKVCDEIFGRTNYIASLVRKTKTMTGDDLNGMNIQHEYSLIYSKTKKILKLNGGEKTLKGYSNPDNDENGIWTSADPSAKSGGNGTYFPIKNPYTNHIDYPPKGRYWAFSKATLSKYIEQGRIKFKKTHRDNERGFIFKRYAKYLENKNMPFSTLKFTNNLYLNSSGTNELNEIFKNSYFDYPKPIEFIKEIINSYLDKNCTVLDFFSGSATTAHAVMQLNAEDGGNRKFIMVQLPEETDEKSEAYKAGYKNICEIGKERIRRAGEKILEENKDKENIDKLDVGFRVLKTDSSNMKDVYYSPENTEQSFLDNLEDNIKEDRTQEDLLFQVMLDLGVPLSSTIEVEQIEDAKVFKVEDRFLVACFDGAISDEVVRQIADMKPFYAVFRDMSMKNDSVAVNFEQIFESISPETIRKVL
ncbi:site-specific DNA-methyltransferase [Finegoldia magna]|uniref:site-specific DNA-methyltransferase n=1 Tax=Finegoldia magna TaxID=1260 RepID=UPI00370DB942